MAIAVSQAAAALAVALALIGAAQAQTMYRITHFAYPALYPFNLTANDNILARGWNGDSYSAFKCSTRDCKELPKQPRTQWTAMNDSGVLMGWIGKKGGDGYMTRKRPGMAMEKFPAQPADVLWPTGGRPIAPDGAMVGVDRNGYAVIITDTLRVLPGLAGRGGVAYGINAAHVVVGLSVPISGGGHHATMWINGQPQDLGVPPGHTYSAAYDVNDSNVAVGYSYVGGKLQQAARFAPGSPAVAFTPANNIRESRAYSINNKGEIVGTMWNADTHVARAFIVENDTLVDLNERLSADDQAGHYLKYAIAINDKGKIVAVDDKFIATAVLLEPIKAQP